ncbi:MAG: hypothetical protein KCHDKBKB_00403 [Elusimicrobia bacterium]|nr:hypothetical protein [Elusimicrobiota bacterium]
MVVSFKSNNKKGFFLGGALLFSVICIGFIAAIVSLNASAAKLINSQVIRDRLHRTVYDAYTMTLAKIASGTTINGTLIQSLGGASFGTSIISGSNSYSQYQVKTAALENFGGDLKDVNGLDGCALLYIEAENLKPNTSTINKTKGIAVVQVANAGRFFVACQTSWGIGPNFVSTEADIYARDVSIWANGLIKPSVNRIFYFNRAISFDLNVPYPNSPIEEVDGTSSNRFFTSDVAGTGYVNQLSAEPIFPQLTAQKMNDYKTMAQSVLGGAAYYAGNAVFPDDIPVGKWKSGNEIYPPGCTDRTCSNITANAGTANAELAKHIYFIEGDLTIHGIVYGQVLFVANGKIIVNGDLISDSLAGNPATRDNDNPLNPYPGCTSPCKADKNQNATYPNGSNAHQIGLITTSVIGVQVDNHATEANRTIFGTGTTLELEALIMAPNGSYSVTDPTSGSPVIDYIFLGGFIIRNSPNESGRVQAPAGVTNYYNYMVSLRDRPLPFLPGFTQTLIWYETGE